MPDRHGDALYERLHKYGRPESTAEQLQFLHYLLMAYHKGAKMWGYTKDTRDLPAGVLGIKDLWRYAFKKTWNFFSKNPDGWLMAVEEFLDRLGDITVTESRVKKLQVGKVYRLTVNAEALRNNPSTPWNLVKIDGIKTGDDGRTYYEISRLFEIDNLLGRGTSHHWSTASLSDLSWAVEATEVDEKTLK